MPKATFLNLPPSKRRLFIDLALEEFSANTYHRASVSRIVKRAGIAKGSVYQYFEDKFDLYVYLLDELAREKLEVVGLAVKALGPDAGLFDKLRGSVRATVSLAGRKPKLFAVGENLMRETDQALLSRVLEHFKPTSDTIISDWFVRGVERGEIDREVSPATAAYVFSAVNVQVSQDISTGRLPLDKAQAFMDQVFDILERGMRPRADGSRQAPRDGPKDGSGREKAGER